MKSQRVSFEGAAGNRLTGQLELPAHGEAGTAPHSYALFAHCFTCTRNIRAARVITQALARQGIATLRFDFTGLGDSEGDFADTNFSSNVQDLLAAAQFLEREYAAPALLVGHSLGGTAVLAAAPSIASAKAVATIGSPFLPAHVAHLLEGSREQIERDGEAEVFLGGRPFRIRRQFLQDLEARDVAKVVRSLRRALLVMHAPGDTTVGINNAAEIFQTAKHPKSFVSLDDADHLLTRTADAEYAASVLAAWAGRYVQAPSSPASTTQADEPARPEAVRARTGASGFFTQIDAAGHPMVADEPVAVGGTGLGPSPYGYLSAALAACTSMTVRMYADHKKIPLRSVSVDVRHNKIHAEDCAQCDERIREGSAGQKVDVFERRIAIDGNIDEATRKRMLQIADRCPVHRTLHNEVVVTTVEATGSDEA